MIPIRRVRPGEADALTRIAIAAKRHWGYPEHWMEIWMPQLTFTPDYFETNESWVAVEQDAPIAFYTVQEREGSAWIENMWVDPAWIGHGIGKKLFQHAVSCAKAQGYQTLQLEADPNALGFYEKMGMGKIGERLSEVDGQPRILPIMEIPI
jgi:GNAT superfamily N-acetyltransferase